MSQTEPVNNGLMKEDGNVETSSNNVSPVAPAADEEAINYENLKDNDGNKTGDNVSVAPKLASREASARIANNNGEPPPIDKQTLLGLITVYFSVFLDMMGISIVQPVLPFYAEKFGANSFQLGALYSSYSLMATFASYAMGKASDRFGRRPSILFSLFGTMIGFTVTGLATNYGSLLAYRFLTGSFGGSAPIAQAYITDVVPSTQRPKYLAFTGATAALSFIIGPGLGSGLSEFGIRIPFFVSGGLGGFGLIFAYFALHESHPRLKDSSNTKKTDDMTKDDPPMQQVASTEPELDHDQSVEPTSHVPDHSRDLSPELSANTSKSSIPWQVWILGTLNVFNMMGWTAYTSMFAYYVILEFGVSTLAVGYITLCLATIYVFTNIVIFSKLSKKIGVYMCCFYGLLIFSIFLTILPIFSFDLWLTLLCIGIGAGIGNGMVFPSMSAMAADYTNPDNRGKILAFSNAAQNIGMVIGPLFHGIVFEIESSLVFYSAGGFVFCAWLCILTLVIKDPKLRTVKEVKSREIVGTRSDDGKEWTWKPDKPNDNDYKKLGRFLGKLMSKRNYNWVSHYDAVCQYLKDIFPPVRTQSLQEHVEDINYLIRNVKNVRSEYDAAHAVSTVNYA